MVKHVIRRRLRSERGAELIELAIVLPILLLVVAGIVDFALAMQRFLTLNNAAREGARIAVLPGYTQTDVQNRVTQYVREGTGDDTASPTTVVTAVTIDPAGPTPAFPAAQVTVTLTHSYLFLGPVSGLFGGGSFSSITLTARSTMRIES
ncbi:MAG TPA: TadE/TadG family type IV pilus assembly protein [Vicinamibacterales bacterium]|nr:TadE/TadG family type IV pilus assembly protein [Vicinamibacterales bacterium]